MWAYHSIFYQIYPIGFCGAPVHNDGQTVPRIRKLLDWTDYLSDLGVDSILLNPIFESDNHGYDTRDFRKLDCGLAPTMILSKSARRSTATESVWYWTEYSTMSAAVSGHFAMFRKRNGILLIKTGSILILTGTADIMTASGTKAGKDTTNWSN